MAAPSAAPAGGAIKTLANTAFQRRLYASWPAGAEDMSRQVLAGARFGGPIAMVPDERKVLVLKAAEDRPRMRIRTCAGTQLAEFPWIYSGLVGLGWTQEEELLAVLRDGLVIVYDVYGDRQRSFSLGSQCKIDGVAECFIWGTGLVVRTAGKSELFAILDVKQPRPVPLAIPQLTTPPTAMAVVPPTAARLSLPRSAQAAGRDEGEGDGPSKPAAQRIDVIDDYARNDEVTLMPMTLLATADKRVILVDADDARSIEVSEGPFSRMSVSPDGSMVACFSDQGVCYVMSSSFDRRLSSFSTGARIPPVAIGWCGNDAVVLSWEASGAEASAAAGATPHIVLMIPARSAAEKSPFVSYKYDCAVHLISEMDGVRIVTDTGCELLQRVPTPVQRVFAVGSVDAAALLRDASRALKGKSVRAHENLQLIDSRGGAKALATAVKTCLEAALHEFDHEQQRELLSAASFGKLSTPSNGEDDVGAITDYFVDMCRTLRVLNAIRHTEVGIPLTYYQFANQGAEVVLDRLVRRNMHLRALRIAQYLKMDPEGILVNWACAKISAANDANDDDTLRSSSDASAPSDAELGQLIIDKLRVCPGVGFEHIAKTAFREGRRGLAVMLVEFEPRASSQIPLLLGMQEDELALRKACESGDADLVHLVLLRFRTMQESGKLGYKAFFKLVSGQPLATSLFIQMCRAEGDLKALKTFYYHLHQPAGAADVTIQEAYRASSWRERLQGMDTALEFYQKDRAANAFAMNATEEQLMLLRTQAKCQLAPPERPGEAALEVVDLSVSSTIREFILCGQAKRAIKLKHTFKVPERRLWSIEVNTLAKCGAWDELAKLTTSTKGGPPIGFRPFVEACVEVDAKEEAAKYIAQLKEPAEKMEWFCIIGRWGDAAQVAFEDKDVDALRLIRSRCREAPIIQQIDFFMDGLTKR